MASPLMPKKMPAWRTTFDKADPFLKEIDTPEPAEDELLVRILAMGVCHSDCTLLALSAPIYGMKSEFTLGHEACGEIVSLGTQVKDFAVGDKVAMHIIPGCALASCADCSRGMNRVCRAPGSGNYGLGLSDGFFAQYATISARAAVKMPEGLRVEEAAVGADAVLTAYYAVRYTGGVSPNDTVAIFGLGGVGLNGLQTALYLGVGKERILVADKRQSVLNEAVKLRVPASHTFLVGDEAPSPIEAYVAEKGVQVDVVFDFVGHEQTMKAAQMVVRSGGTIVLVGLMSPVVPLVPLVTVLKAATIKTGYNGTMEAFRECLELMAKGVLKPSVETGSIRKLPEVLRDLDEGMIKNRMVLLPDWEA
ncbi:uncharacterized protein N0V89_010190 [Didymosphaeria variabile]|uniref:Enoyl reductase (ER) domain-containing protein n=1 Tax=Didymosphaeria variabile TaxID=1932322 RepID=A0A9W8XFA1_9PLEO|nr:uncharacterized protein N0V89_010190 [Didymosphaeria variabile]KAJ4348812.1 hypothetical protein N0V89_010190 [Didymosphaeria variabile]